jgi:hypothetical protein
MGVTSSKASYSSSSLPPLPPITAGEFSLKLLSFYHIFIKTSMILVLKSITFTAPPAPPVPDSQQKASGSAVTAEDVLSNPGTYEEIGRKLKGKKDR